LLLLSLSLLLLLLVPYDIPYHPRPRPAKNFSSPWTIGGRSRRSFWRPSKAHRGRRRRPGMARDGQGSVETTGWFGGKHSPNKGGKAKGCHWLLVGFDGSIFFGGCHIYDVVYDACRNIAKQFYARCWNWLSMLSVLYVHVLSLFLLLVDD
jgi:hypothetical protein